MQLFRMSHDFITPLNIIYYVTISYDVTYHAEYPLSAHTDHIEVCSSALLLSRGVVTVSHQQLLLHQLLVTWVYDV